MQKLQKQSGTILIVFLGWLAVLSVIGIGALRQSLGMGETAQAQHLAVHTFEAAEAALLAAQQALASWGSDPPAACAQLCVVPAENLDFYARQPNQWWQAQGNAAVTPLPWLDAVQAYFVIEYLITQPDGANPEIAHQFFRITAKALASHKRAATVLQLTVSKPVEAAKNAADKQKVGAELTTLKGDATPVIRQAWRQYY